MTTARRYQLLTSLVALLALVGTDAQSASAQPRLVVNVVIDQLRSDYMAAYSSCYGERGFRRLMEEGRAYDQAEYPFSGTDRASAVATLLTGCTPFEHGIVGERWLDRSTLLPRQCVDDGQYPALGVSENGSAAALAVSTLADELKVATAGKALVYSVAPFRDAAILAAGHAANAAFWLSDQTGLWTTTSYYGPQPLWTPTNKDPLPAAEPKRKRGKKSKGKDKTPEPDKPVVKYAFKGDSRFRDFKTSALVNEEVSRLALHCVDQGEMGLDDTPDLLNITYYAGSPQHEALGAKAPEMEDVYVRLDRTLGEMMDSIEARVGQGDVLFVVTSTGYADEEQADLTPYRVPTGTFSISKAQFLLNMYLVAVYGEGKYVEASMGGELYLDQTLVERRGLNMAELLERSQDFLIQMAGVRDVYTSRRLALSSADRNVSRIRNGYNPRTSGDILVKVAPGWHLVNGNLGEDHIVRDAYLAFPLFFLGAGVEKGKVELPVVMSQVAPTIAKAIRIRAPNGCSAMPLTLR